MTEKWASVRLKNRIYKAPSGNLYKLIIDSWQAPIYTLINLIKKSGEELK